MCLSPVEELLRLSSAQAKLLLEGDASQIETLLTAVAPRLPRPVTTWDGTRSLPAVREGMLIVPLVNRFDDDQQRQLLRWIEETAGTVGWSPPRRDRCSDWFSVGCFSTRFTIVSTSFAWY